MYRNAVKRSLKSTINCYADIRQREISRRLNQMTEIIERNARGTALKWGADELRDGCGSIHVEGYGTLDVHSVSK